MVCVLKLLKKATWHSKGPWRPVKCWPTTEKQPLTSALHGLLSLPAAELLQLNYFVSGFTGAESVKWKHILRFLRVGNSWSRAMLHHLDDTLHTFKSICISYLMAVTVKTLEAIFVRGHCNVGSWWPVCMELISCNHSQLSTWIALFIGAKWFCGWNQVIKI